MPLQITGKNRLFTFAEQAATPLPMRFWFISLLLLAAQPKAADWQLVWSDEFNGSKLDYGKWGVSVDAFGGGNQEMQLYTDRAKNVRVENGKLIIEAHRDLSLIHI